MGFLAAAATELLVAVRGLKVMSLIFCATGPDGVQVMWCDQSSAERICWKEGCELLLCREEIAESL